jgi:hypothetical protein
MKRKFVFEMDIGKNVMPHTLAEIIDEALKERNYPVDSGTKVKEVY